MEKKEITVQQVDITVLKAQNLGLLTRVSSLRRRLAGLEGLEEKQTETLANCALVVDSFVNKMKILFQSVKAGRSYVSLAPQDPMQQVTETFFSSIALIGEKLSAALREGKKPECDKDINVAATAVMTAFQGFINERARFNELLSAGEEITGTLRERCEFLENEKLALLRKQEAFDRELAELKAQSGNTTFLLSEISNLKMKLEHMNLRFEKLSGYSTQSVEDILNSAETDKNYTCMCGASLLNSTNAFIEEMKKEFANYKPSTSTQGAKDINGVSQNGQNSAFKEENLEKENKIRELQEKVHQQAEEIAKSKISKELMDSKFLQSNVLEDLVKQLSDVVSYNKAEKKVADIQIRRAAELNEIFDKNNSEKLKLSLELQQSQKDLGIYKKMNIEMQKRFDDKISPEGIANQNMFEQSRKLIETLNKQLKEATADLVAEKEKLRHEQHRVYKYEKELQNAKDNYYNELLNRYAKCESITMRHTRHEDIFKKLYSSITPDSQTGLTKDDVDELVQYVKGRDDKLNHLEKKWKKVEKELDAERKQSGKYVKALEETSEAYTNVTTENEQLKKEVADLNVNFSKVCKDKATDKQAYDLEASKIKNELRNLKEAVPALKGSLVDLNKNIAIKDKYIHDVEHSFSSQKQLLDQIYDERNKFNLESENLRKEVTSKDSQLKAYEASVSKLSKENSECKTQVTDKNKIIEKYLKANKLDSDIDIKKLTESDYLSARIELKMLRRKVYCTLCEKREKDRILENCRHRFCNECLMNILQRRERKCPACGDKFCLQNIKQLYEDN